MKILFLDVDGVLNYDGLWQSTKNRPPNHGTFVLDPDLISRMNLILRRTGALMVLSSAWRTCDRHCDYLRHHNVFTYAHSDWRTICHPSGFRGLEVEEWLQRHPEVTHKAIVDDNSDFHSHQHSFFVQTDPAVGLTEEDALRLENLLT